MKLFSVTAQWAYGESMIIVNAQSEERAIELAKAHSGFDDKAKTWGWEAEELEILEDSVLTSLEWDE